MGGWRRRSAPEKGTEKRSRNKPEYAQQCDFILSCYSTGARHCLQFHTDLM